METVAKSRPAGAEDSDEVLQKNGKAENEERGERDEKSVAVARDPAAQVTPLEPNGLLKLTAPNFVNSHFPDGRSKTP